jgi:hypothetical protein
LIDLDFEIKADQDRVELGATKEAGPLGIRVAEPMRAENGGTIVNAFGSVGEGRGNAGGNGRHGAIIMAKRGA